MPYTSGSQSNVALLQQALQYRLYVFKIISSNQNLFSVCGFIRVIYSDISWSRYKLVYFTTVKYSCPKFKQRIFFFLNKIYEIETFTDRGVK